MTTMDHRLPSAISSDASLVAVVVPSTSTSTTSRRHLIQLYRVASSSSSCSLQSTLTHSTDQIQLNEIIFCGSSMLIALFGTVEVVVWDLDRGVVAHKFSTKDDENFLALASSSETFDPTSGSRNNEPPSFYILTRNGSKLYSQECQNGKVIRKLKSGKWEEDEHQLDGEECNKIWGLAVTKEHIVVKSSNGIRLMRSDTAKKVRKITGKGGLRKMVICSNQQIGGGSDDDDTLAVLESAGSVVLYSIPDGKEMARIPHEMTTTSSQHATFQLLKSNKSKAYKLLIESSVYSITGSSFEEVTKLTTSKSNLVAVFLLKTKLLALMHQIGGCRSIWFDLEDKSIPATISLDDAETAEDDADSNGASKRKAGNNQPIMLGPGQAGMEASEPLLKKARVETKKGMKVEEDDNEDGPSDGEKNMSIAERLQKLAEAMDDDDDDLLDDDYDDLVAKNVSFKPKSATTESLKEFLTQALQSGDESLLELALQVQDKKLIARSVKDIDASLVGILCNKLTAKLASNPLRSEQLCKWISLCLQAGNFKPQHTMPLRNLLDERVETYPDMLRLQGRLSALFDTE